MPVPFDALRLWLSVAAILLSALVAGIARGQDRTAQATSPATARHTGAVAEHGDAAVGLAAPRIAAPDLPGAAHRPAFRPPD